MCSQTPRSTHRDSRGLRSPADDLMESYMKPSTLIIVAAIAAIAVGIGAQQTGFKRTVIQQENLSVPGREAVTAIAEFQPGATVGQHTHPGEEIGYVLEA